MDRETKNKIKATLFIIIFLLMCAVIIYFIMGNKERSYYAPVTPIANTETPSATPTPEVTAAPTPLVISTPQATEEIEATPDPTPESTPEVTETPVSVVIGEEIASGEFRSDTGAYIDLIASYSAWFASPEIVEVGVTVNLSHYTIHAISGDTLNIALGDKYINLNVPAIDSDDNSQQLTTLGAYTFSIPLTAGQTTTVPLTVEWHFGGVYHGVDLSVIECGGEITLN